jgi:hypothetical protein
MSETKDGGMSDEPRPDSPQTPAAAAPETKPPPRMRAATATATPTVAVPDPRAQQKVRFDSASIKSTYCNVCNATSTREEVIINFGVNKNWDMGGPDLEVQLEHRIILSPFAAKRLQDMLVRLITEHEQRYGKLN